jgi:hypothetical protein
MTVKALFEWLKKNDAKIAFGFKKKVPYIAVRGRGVKMSYRLGAVNELEEALAGLIEGKLEEKHDEAR